MGKGCWPGVRFFYGGEHGGLGCILLLIAAIFGALVLIGIMCMLGWVDFVGPWIQN